MERLTFEDEQKGHGKGKRPGKRDLGKVMVPEIGGEQGEEGDGQQYPGKGDNRPQRQHGPEIPVPRGLQTVQGGESGRRRR